MPQGEAYWNPYRMIPIRDIIKRERPTTDERFTGQSGMISCTLENLTPLFIGGNPFMKNRFLTRNQRSVIPGSSIKGMVRSLAEIVGGGCSVTNHDGNGRRYHDIPPAQYRACKDNRALCIACRMFGMMGRGQRATVHKGNVSVCDALIRENTLKTVPLQVLLMSKKDSLHTSFYTTPGTNKFDGLCRKLYFHQPQRISSLQPIPLEIQKMMQEHMQSIDALLPGHHFDFDVSFSNLKESEFSLLIYVLALEDEVEVDIEEAPLTLRGPMRHKIGLAKPLGMGSCHITINKIVTCSNSKDRFSSLGDMRETVYHGDSLQGKIAQLIEQFVSDKSATMQQLRKMMAWDMKDTRTFKYPDFHWFNNVGNSLKGLKPI